MHRQQSGCLVLNVWRLLLSVAPYTMNVVNFPFGMSPTLRYVTDGHDFPLNLEQPIDAIFTRIRASHA